MRLSVADNLETLVVRISTSLARVHDSHPAFFTMVNNIFNETIYTLPDVAGCFPQIRIRPWWRSAVSRESLCNPTLDRGAIHDN